MNQCLKLIEVCSVALCDSNATLIDAEVINDFMINSLSELDTHFSRVFLDKIKSRIAQRRTFASDLVCFLSNLPGKINVKFNFYKEPSNEEIKKFIMKIIKF